MKNIQSKIKPIKFALFRINHVILVRTTSCLGYKDFTHNFRPQEVKMKNKVFREKSCFSVK